METESLFRRKRRSDYIRRWRAHSRAAAPALVDALEDRVLLAATAFQTPIDVDVSTQPDRHQSIAKVGIADNGDFVVLWEDIQNPGTAEEHADVAFRRFSADGTPKDAQQRYVVQSAVDEFNVATAVDSSGGFVAVWQQFDTVSSTYDIWYARYDAAGSALVAPTQANVNTGGDQANPAVAISDDGTYVVAWEDFGADASGDVAVRRFDVNGAIDASESYVASTANLVEFEPDVAMNGTNNDWVVTWSQGESSGTDQFLDVRYELRSAAGSVVAQGSANATTANDQNRSSVAMADNGTFVIAWESEQSSGTPGPANEVNDVAFRRFSNLGAALDPTDQFIAADASLDEQDPVVGINGAASRFVIGYELSDPANRDATAAISFQVFDGSGTLTSGPSAIGGGVPVQDAQIAMNPLGDFVLAYTELTDFTTHPDRIAAAAIPLLKASEIVVSAGPGGGPAVSVTDMLTGQKTRSFFAFPSSFRGGTTVATGDLNGDTFPEIIVGVASDGLPAIRVFDGSSGAMLSSFLAFPAGFRGGLTVAVGDVTGDGTLDVVVGARAGGGPVVRVFNGLTGAPLGSHFFAFGQAFRGGVNVATGDIDGDGTDEIIVGAGPGGGPVVRVFDFATLAGVELGAFFAFPIGFRGGVSVSAGDFDEDGDSEIVTGAGPGGGPVLRMYEPDGTPIGNPIFAFPTGFRGGVHVGTGDVNDDGETDIVVGAGPGGGPVVRAFDPDTEAQIGTPLFAFPVGFRGGVFVAGRALGLPGEGSPLTVDPSTPPLVESGPVLEASDLPAIIDAAQSRFSMAGLSPELLAALSGVQFFVTDLGGDLLGLARPGRVFLDGDAAGYGWFVDYSPLLDDEFFGDGSTLMAIEGGAAADRVDLLSVILHELGHALGLEHDGGFMSHTLMPGIRRVPTAEDLDSLFAESDLLAVG